MQKIRYTWEEERTASYNFPIVVNSDFKTMSRVHPLQQKVIASIRNSTKNDHRICSIVLFGSSTNMRCYAGSDVDLVVRLYPEFNTTKDKNEISETIQLACDWNADVLWYDRLAEDDRVFKECLMGVQIL